MATVSWFFNGIHPVVWNYCHFIRPIQFLRLDAKKLIYMYNNIVDWQKQVHSGSEAIFGCRIREEIQLTRHPRMASNTESITKATLFV
ncbi:MAG: hypothetical protein AAB721_00490 [Patescibacteria group bacterium]